MGGGGGARFEGLLESISEWGKVLMKIIAILMS